MCKPKTLLKISAIVVVLLAVGWMVFPQIRSSFVALAPFALVLICPLAMLVSGHGAHRSAHGDARTDDDCCAGAAKHLPSKSSSRSGEAAP